MVGALNFPRDEGINVVITHAIKAWGNFPAIESFKGWLREYLPRQADAGAEGFPVSVTGHVIELDGRGGQRVC
jgi:hypothetical protein